MRLRVRTEFACSQGWGCCAIIIKNSSGFTLLGLLGAPSLTHSSRLHSHPLQVISHLQLLLALSLSSPRLLTRVYIVLVAHFYKNSSDQTPSNISTQFFLRYPTAPPGSSSVRSNTYILTESFPILTCMGALPHPKTIARS